MSTDTTAPGPGKTEGEPSLEESTDVHPTRVRRSELGSEPTQVAAGSEHDLGSVSTDKDLPRGTGQPRGEAAVRSGASIGGRYRVIRLIARGSMSRIYQAEQVSIHRTVALKIIGHEFARDGQAVARFRQEAALLANISHPNIVTVHDIGTTAAGEPYIVMEHVDGPSLAEVIRDGGRLPLERTLSLLLQISRALATVHRQGVIHRDMKPGNVLLARRGQAVEIAKLVDFGLAKVIQDRSEGQFLTRTGTILGTPEYMSPEQVRGGQIDHRADIYSLGCMAYEMLTGSPPFVGEEMSTLYRHLHEKPMPMAEACPEAKIPAEIDQLLARAMEKDPADRFDGAQAFYNGLLAACDALAIPRSRLHLFETLLDDGASGESTGGAGASQRMPAAATPAPAPRRRRIELLLAVAVLMGGALLAGIALGQRHRGESPRAAAVVEGAASAPAVAPQLLLVDSTPAGATVDIDGTPVAETTPTAVRGLSVGEHTVRLHLAGYATIERSVTLAAGERGSIDVRLPPPRRELVVKTVPSDALVFLDDKLISSFTPTAVQVGLEDFHELRIEKDGFEPLVRRITPDDRDPELTLTLELEKRPIGAIWVDSNDTAEVWIDGMDTGFITPTFGLRVPVGRHTVELRDSTGNHSRPVKVDVAQGKNVHLTMSVERGK